VPINSFERRDCFDNSFLPLSQHFFLCNQLLCSFFYLNGYSFGRNLIFSTLILYNSLYPFYYEFSSDPRLESCNINFFLSWKKFIYCNNDVTTYFKFLRIDTTKTNPFKRRSSSVEHLHCDRCIFVYKKWTEFPYNGYLGLRNHLHDTVSLKDSFYLVQPQIVCFNMP